MGKQFRVISGFGGEQSVTLDVGKEYVVQPANPRATKNRNRKCVILDFVPASDARPHDIVAKVRYLDNNRVGRVEPSDLVPA